MSLYILYVVSYTYIHVVFYKKYLTAFIVRDAYVYIYICMTYVLNKRAFWGLGCTATSRTACTTRLLPDTLLLFTTRCSQHGHLLEPCLSRREHTQTFPDIPTTNHRHLCPPPIQYYLIWGGPISYNMYCKILFVSLPPIQ